MENHYKIDSDQTVLLVGLVCVDVFYVMERFPIEDSSNKVQDRLRQRGGNASNSASVFSFLRGKVEYFGTIADDRELGFICSDFQENNVKYENSVIIPRATCPMSIVMISTGTATRTVLHTNKSLRELTLRDLQENIQLDSKTYGWIHFEGRNNAKEIASMLRYVNTYNQTLSTAERYIITSFEAEKLRLIPEMEKYNLWQLPDVLFVSKDFAQNLGYSCMTGAVKGLFANLKAGAVLICAWGEKGAAAMSTETGMVTSPAFPPEKVIDTCGAGDTFVAATIFALSRGKGLQDAITFGCKIAGAKCGMQGYKGLKDAQYRLEVL